MREMKTQLGKEICNYMTDNNLNSHIEISDGELRFFEKKEYTTLSFGYVEKCLHENLNLGIGMYFFYIQYTKIFSELLFLHGHYSRENLNTLKKVFQFNILILGMLVIIVIGNRHRHWRSFQYFFKYK